MSLGDLFFIYGAKYLYIMVLAIAGLSFLQMKRKKQKELFVLAVVSFPIVLLVSKIGAYLYFNPRPFVVEHFTPLLAHDPDNGFPSDHTLLLSSVTMLFAIYQRKISYLLFTLTIVVGFSRIYVGIHHAVDIVGSIFMSVTTVTLSHYIHLHFKMSKQGEIKKE